MKRRHQLAMGSITGVMACALLVGAGSLPSGAAAKPSGSPVTIGVIYNATSAEGLDPDVATGAQAGAQYVNANLGGFNGHPVKIDACSDANDPTQTTNCARRFVSEGAVTAIGLSPNWGAAGLPALAAANIPSMTAPISTPEFVSPDSFPFISGSTAAETPGLVYYFTKIVKGVKAGGTLSVNIPTAVSGLQLGWVTPMQKAGVKMGAIVQVDPTSPDYSSAVEEAASGNPQVIFMAFAEADCAQVLTQAATLGVKTTWAAYGSCGSPQLLQTAKSAANGFVVSQDTLLPTDTANPDVRTFQKAMKKYAPGKPLSEQALDSFSAVVTLERIFAQPGGVPSSATLTTWLHDGSNLVNVFAGATFGKPNSVAPYTQVYNSNVRIVQVKKGKFVDVGGGWVNGITGKVTKKFK